MNPTTLIRQHALSLWDRRWTIVLVAWVLCLAGWVIVTLLPNRYESSARIYVDTESLLRPLMQGLAIQPDRGREVELVRRTLLSRPNLQQLMQMTDLGLTVDTPADQEALMTQLATDIHVVPQGPGLYRVSYQNNDPQMAERMVDAVLTIFVEQNLGSGARDIENSIRFIDAQIEDYERQLSAAERRLAEFRLANADHLGGQVSAQSGLRSAEGALRRLETQLQASIWRRDQLQIELASTPPAIVQPALDGVTQVAQLRQQLAVLRLTLTDQHPDVIALRRQIQLAQTQGGGSLQVPNPVHEQLQDQLNRLNLDIEAIERQIELAHQDVDRMTTLFNGVPEVEVELAQLNRDYGVLRSNYNTLVERRESARLSQRLQNETTSVQFRIVEPPTVPTTPSFPNRPLLYGGVLVASLMAGFGVALLLGIMKPSFAAITQLRDAFGLPVLGSVSSIRTAMQRRVKVAEMSALTTSLIGLVALGGTIIYYSQVYGDILIVQDVARGLFGRVAMAL